MQIKEIFLIERISKVSASDSQGFEHLVMGIADTDKDSAVTRFRALIEYMNNAYGAGMDADSALESLKLVQGRDGKYRFRSKFPEPEKLDYYTSPVLRSKEIHLYNLAQGPYPEKNFSEIIYMPVDMIEGREDPQKLSNVTKLLKMHKQLPPILVEKTDSGKYDIVDGHHRWKAAKQLGIKKIPVIIKKSR